MGTRPRPRRSYALTLKPLGVPSRLLLRRPVVVRSACFLLSRRTRSYPGRKLVREPRKRRRSQRPVLRPHQRGRKPPQRQSREPRSHRSVKPRFRLISRLTTKQQRRRELPHQGLPRLRRRRRLLPLPRRIRLRGSNTGNSHQRSCLTSGTKRSSLQALTARVSATGGGIARRRGSTTPRRLTARGSSRWCLMLWSARSPTMQLVRAM